MLIHASSDHIPRNSYEVQAAEWLKNNGLPQHKLEHWRMTPVHRLLQQEFTLVQDDSIEGAAQAVADYRAEFSPEAGCLIVLCHGVYSTDLSDFTPRAGVELGSDQNIGSVLDFARLPFAAQNLSHNSAEALAVNFSASQTDALHILSLHGGSGASFQQMHIRLAAGVSATVVESHYSLNAITTKTDGYAGYSNSLVQLELQDNARLGHYKWQNLATDHAHIAVSVVQVGQSAHLDAFVLNMGGGLVRQDTEVAIVGAQAEAIINGAYIGSGRQHMDNTSQIKHLVPDSYSREVYKGVLSDQAQGVFQARILVDQIAQRTDAYQMNRALLLSNQSEVRSKPELEIYADDVKCSHGATVGQLDKDQLFYLMARGIRRVHAQTLLIEAYLEDVFADMTDKDLAAKFAGLARKKLHEIAKAL